MSSIDRVIEESKKILDYNTHKNKNRALKEIDEIVSHFLNVDRSYLHSHGEHEVDEELANSILKAIEDRKDEKPMEYITNRAFFMDEEYYVDERVLVPRFETARVVELASHLIKEHNIKSVADICTGSGIIAISLKKRFRDIKIIASDISEEALEVAKINAKNKKTDIEFIHSDMFENIEENCELIVSNPPYISEDYEIGLELTYEPNLALFAKEDEIKHYKTLIRECINRDIKYLLCEIGHDQKEKLIGFIESEDIRYKELKFYKDVNEFDRVMMILF